MKIGFIGAGNMAQAIIKGLLSAGTFSSEAIFITATSLENAKRYSSELGVQSAASNQALVSQVDIIILAVKPHIIPAVLTDIQPILKEKETLLISIAAGQTLTNLANHLPEIPTQKIIRVMPNINVTVNKGVSAITANEYVNSNEIALTETIFNAVGSSYLIAEKDFQNFTSLAGCSPAYSYLFIDAMSRAGVKNGLPKELATKIATEAVLGSAEMLKQHPEETPWDLIDKVCSPGGTTVAGLVSLENDAFTGTVIKALDATIARDQELASE